MRPFRARPPRAGSSFVAAVPGDAAPAFASLVIFPAFRRVRQVFIPSILATASRRPGRRTPPGAVPLRGRHRAEGGAALTRTIMATMRTSPPASAGLTAVPSHRAAKSVALAGSTAPSSPPVTGPTAATPTR